MAKPKDFAMSELARLLRGFGYAKVRAGKTAGSRLAYFCKERSHLIRLHRPHPEKALKRYQLDLIEDELRAREVLK